MSAAVADNNVYNNRITNGGPHFSASSKKRRSQKKRRSAAKQKQLILNTQAVEKEQAKEESTNQEPIKCEPAKEESVKVEPTTTESTTAVQSGPENLSSSTSCTTVNNGYYKGEVCNAGVVVTNEEPINDATTEEEPINSKQISDDTCTTINNGYYKGEVCNAGVVSPSSPTASEPAEKDEEETEKVDAPVQEKDAVSTERIEDNDSSEWRVTPSDTANNTLNPIRAIVDEMVINPNPKKKMIALSLGDPTVFGNFPPPPEANEAIINAVINNKNNGYGPSVGTLQAREAVAQYLNKPTAPVTPSDVYLSSGCSQALDLAITVLGNPGDNILMPRPGFPLYETLAKYQGIDVKHYELIPEQSWEVDLEHLESLIDEKTKALVLVNPSNPCGSCYSKEHLQNFIKVAEKHHISIIADEVYADIVYAGEQFYDCASLSENVPVFTCGGIAKRFLVPGWRLGWLVLHDRKEICGPKVRSALLKLTQRVLHPCTLVQAALPALLKTPDSFHKNTVKKLENAAHLIYDQLKTVPGLYPVKPQAAMYMMVGFKPEEFKDLPNDLTFTEKLITEQSVFCLPSQCFKYKNYFRIVLSVPEDQIEEACGRMREFCQDHHL